MIYATSDLHGYPLQSFLNLLAKVEFGPSDQLYVIGDVIDRNGDGGVAMLRWMMKQPNVTLLRGNHEAMLLDCDFLFTTDTDILSMRDLGPKQERDLYIWHRNGALVTIDSLMKLKKSDPEELSALFAYIRSTPVYLELAVPMKRFLLVHGGLYGFSPEKGMDEYDPRDLLWTRPDLNERYWKKKKGRAFVTPTWIDIDTGAAGGDCPMLLRLDDLAEIYCDVT